jgi:hypothetical protein
MPLPFEVLGSLPSLPLERRMETEGRECLLMYP